MSNHIIAVGGTGQMIALAYLKLARLCGYRDGDIAEIHIVDSDRTGDTCEQIATLLHKAKNALKTVAPIPSHRKLGSFSQDFDEAGTNDNIRRIAPLLYTAKDLEVNVRKGLYGRPSVGSACMSIKTNPPAGHNTDPELIALRDSVCQPGNKVVICGSLFGGTGAGVIPTLARFLRNSQDGNSIEITIVSMLKWFRIPGVADADGGIDKSIDDNMLSANSSAGIFYLKDRITEDVNACVLLGPREPIERDFEKVGQQNEKAYFINLLAAIIASNTLNAGSLDKVFGTIVDPKMYCYVISGGDDNNPQMLSADLLDVFLPGGKNNRIKLHEIIEVSKEVVAILGYFANYIYGGYKSFSFTPSFTRPRWLVKSFKEGTNRHVHALVIERREQLSSLISWYNQLDTQEGHQPYFSTELERINVARKKYNKVRGNPMKFIREWMNDIKVVNDGNLSEEELVDLLIVELRKKINNKFMDNKFGDLYR